MGVADGAQDAPVNLGLRLTALNANQHVIVHAVPYVTYSVHADGRVRYGRAQAGHFMGHITQGSDVLVPGGLFVYRLSELCTVERVIRAVHLYQGGRRPELPELWSIDGGYRQQAVCSFC